MQEFNHVRIRHPHKQAVTKAAELALAWIVKNGNDQQRLALIGNAEVQRSCLSRSIVFPNIPTQPPATTPPLSLARRFISPPRASRNSAGDTTIRPVLNSSLNPRPEPHQCNDLDEQDVPPNRHFVNNPIPVISLSPKVPKVSNPVNENPPTQKVLNQQVSEPSTPVTPIPTVTSLGFEITTSKTVVSSEPSVLGFEPSSTPPTPAPMSTPAPAFAAVSAPAASNSESLDLLKAPLSNSKPTQSSPSLARKRKRLGNLPGNLSENPMYARSPQNQLELAQFDFEESSTVEEGDGNETINTINVKKLRPDTTTAASASATAIDELESIKQDAKRAMNLLQSLVTRIEKLEKQSSKG